MAKAIWNGQVLAESDKTVVVEGNHYFPPDAVKMQYLQPGQTHTVCSWKGVASYCDVVVGVGATMLTGSRHDGGLWHFSGAHDGECGTQSCRTRALQTRRASPRAKDEGLRRLTNRL